MAVHRNTGLLGTRCLTATPVVPLTMTPWASASWDACSHSVQISNPYPRNQTVPVRAYVHECFLPGPVVTDNLIALTMATAKIEMRDCSSSIRRSFFVFCFCYFIIVLSCLFFLQCSRAPSATPVRSVSVRTSGRPQSMVHLSH